MFFKVSPEACTYVEFNSLVELNLLQSCQLPFFGRKKAPSGNPFLAEFHSLWVSEYSCLFPTWRKEQWVFFRTLPHKQIGTVILQLGDYVNPPWCKLEVPIYIICGASLNCKQYTWHSWHYTDTICIIMESPFPTCFLFSGSQNLLTLPCPQNANLAMTRTRAFLVVASRWCNEFPEDIWVLQDHL